MTEPKIVGSTNLMRNAFRNGAHGLYIPEIDLILIMRSKELEKQNGSIYTEGLLVHELAHASSMYQDFISMDKQRFYTPRVGFCLPQNDIPWGWFLEEGWADLHRGNYFSEYATEEQRMRIDSVMKFGQLNFDDTIPIVTNNGDILPLPVKYIYLDESGRPTTKSSAFAAYALELLCYKDPTLYSTLREARYSIEGLKKVAKKINSFYPSLYLFLQTSDYSEEDFHKRLKEIILRLFLDVKTLIKGPKDLQEKWTFLLNS